MIKKIDKTKLSNTEYEAWIHITDKINEIVEAINTMQDSSETMQNKDKLDKQEECIECGAKKPEELCKEYCGNTGGIRKKVVEPKQEANLFDNKLKRKANEIKQILKEEQEPKPKDKRKQIEKVFKELADYFHIETMNIDKQTDEIIKIFNNED